MSETFSHFLSAARDLKWIASEGKRKYGDPRVTVEEFRCLTLPEAYARLRELAKDDSLLESNFWPQMALTYFPFTDAIMQEYSDLYREGLTPQWRECFMNVLKWLATLKIIFKSRWNDKIKNMRPPRIVKFLGQRGPSSYDQFEINADFQKMKLGTKQRTKVLQNKFTLKFKEGGELSADVYEADSAVALVTYKNSTLRIDVEPGEERAFFGDFLGFQWAVNRQGLSLSGQLDFIAHFENLNTAWYRRMLELYPNEEEKEEASSDVQIIPKSSACIPLGASEFARGRPHLGIDAVDYRNIEEDTRTNTYYRHVVYTTEDGLMQLVLMSLKPGETIPAEVHASVQQFVRIEQGQGECVLCSRYVNVETQSNVTEKRTLQLSDGYSVIIPAGVQHEFRNTSDTLELKLYSLYAPAEHAPNLVHERQKDAQEESHVPLKWC